MTLQPDGKRVVFQMPEEQAFCVLVKLMYDYKLRDFYKQGFENLYLRLYQLNRYS